jgi:PAS domain S-box-containing protein
MKEAPPEKFDGSPEPTSPALSDQPNLDLVDAEAILKTLADVFFQNGCLGSSLDAPGSSDSFTEEVRYRSLVEQLPAVVFMASLDKGIGDAYVSPQIEASLGFSQSEWLQDPVRFYAHIHPDDKGRWSTEAAEMFVSGKPLKSCYRVLARDGRVVWFQCEAKMVRREDGRPWFIHGVGFDITDLKMAERALYEKHRELQLLEDIATKANESKSIAEAMQFAVERIREFTNWPLGHVFLVSGDQEQLHSSSIWSSIPTARFDTFRQISEKSEFSFAEDFSGSVFTSGRPAWIRDVVNDPNFSRQSVAHEAGIKSAFAFPVLSEGEVVAVLEFFADISLDSDDALMAATAHIGTQLGQVVKRVRAQEKLLHDAFHDPLTALPNRLLFLDRLERAIARSKRHAEYRFAVLFIDIDHFKAVNDSLGRAAGDELLIQVSHRILRSLRLEDVVARPIATVSPEWKGKDDTLARLGGDEFTILLDEIRDPSDGIRVADRIQRIFADPFVIDGQDIFTTVSIGITTNSVRATADDVLRDADTAMYRAKLHGKAQYEVFDQAMQEQAVNRLKLENDLRKALERNEFRVFYQPIITLRTGNIAGFEALLRWQRTEKGFIPPGEFIGIAEEMGFIVPIGMWVLRTACEQARRWHLEYPREMPLTMSVNVSGRQFMEDDLVAQVAKILQETEVEPSAIKLEVTESVTMGNAEKTIKVISELKKLGLRISLDDFGTGYSSLSYLRRFPIDTLKIDRSFVSNLESNSEKREIIRTIIGLARNLRMDVVAEGTETAAEISYLKTLDCEFAQGYFFSKPVDSVAAQALLSGNPGVPRHQSEAPAIPVNEIA